MILLDYQEHKERDHNHDYNDECEHKEHDQYSHTSHGPNFTNKRNCLTFSAIIVLILALVLFMLLKS